MKLYLAVAKSDVVDAEDQALLEKGVSPWPGVQLSFGGLSAAQTAGFEGAHAAIVGAIIDQAVCATATLFFAGPEWMSSFTRAVIDIRSLNIWSASLHLRLWPGAHAW